METETQLILQQIETVNRGTIAEIKALKELVQVQNSSLIIQIDGLDKRLTKVEDRLDKEIEGMSDDLDEKAEATKSIYERDLNRLGDKVRHIEAKQEGLDKRVTEIENAPAAAALAREQKVKSTFGETFLKFVAGGAITAVGMWVLSQIKGGP